jgi:hypothetical protein
LELRPPSRSHCPTNHTAQAPWPSGRKEEGGAVFAPRGVIFSTCRQKRPSVTRGTNQGGSPRFFFGPKCGWDDVKGLRSGVYRTCACNLQLVSFQGAIPRRRRDHSRGAAEIRNSKRPQPQAAFVNFVITVWTGGGFSWICAPVAQEWTSTTRSLSAMGVGGWVCYFCVFRRRASW